MEKKRKKDLLDWLKDCAIKYNKTKKGFFGTVYPWDNTLFSNSYINPLVFLMEHFEDPEILDFLSYTDTYASDFEDGISIYAPAPLDLAIKRFLNESLKRIFMTIGKNNDKKYLFRGNPYLLHQAIQIPNKEAITIILNAMDDDSLFDALKKHYRVKGGSHDFMYETPLSWAVKKNDSTTIEAILKRVPPNKLQELMIIRSKEEAVRPIFDMSGGSDFYKKHTLVETAIQYENTYIIQAIIESITSGNDIYTPGLNKLLQVEKTNTLHPLKYELLTKISQFIGAFKYLKSNLGQLITTNDTTSIKQLTLNLNEDELVDLLNKDIYIQGSYRNVLTCLLKYPTLIKHFLSKIDLQNQAALLNINTCIQAAQSGYAETAMTIAEYITQHTNENPLDPRLLNAVWCYPKILDLLITNSTTQQKLISLESSTRFKTIIDAIIQSKDIDIDDYPLIKLKLIDHLPGSHTQQKPDAGLLACLKELRIIEKPLSVDDCKRHESLINDNISSLLRYAGPDELYIANHVIVPYFDNSDREDNANIRLGYLSEDNRIHLKDYLEKLTPLKVTKDRTEPNIDAINTILKEIKKIPPKITYYERDTGSLQLLDNAKKSRSDQLTINATKAITFVKTLKTLQPTHKEHMNSILRGAINEMITSSSDSLACNFINSLSARHKQWEQSCDEHLLNLYKAIDALCSRESSDTAVNSLLDLAILECQQLATKEKDPIDTFALDFIASDDFKSDCFNNADKVNSLITSIQKLPPTTNKENVSEEENQATSYSTQIEQAFKPYPYQKILDKITPASSETHAPTKKP